MGQVCGSVNHNLKWAFVETANLIASGEVPGVQTRKVVHRLTAVYPDGVFRGAGVHFELTRVAGCAGDIERHFTHRLVPARRQSDGQLVRVFRRSFWIEDEPVGAHVRRKGETLLFPRMLQVDEPGIPNVHDIGALGRVIESLPIAGIGLFAPALIEITDRPVDLRQWFHMVLDPREQDVVASENNQKRPQSQPPPFWGKVANKFGKNSAQSLEEFPDGFNDEIPEDVTQDSERLC